MAKTGYSKEELDHSYYVGFAEGAKMRTENIFNSVKQEIENGTIKLECGADKLFEIINAINFQ